jgi:glyoxylase-like metal-dependent hydrolase (beta-lactamase superfamily II)
MHLGRDRVIAAHVVRGLIVDPGPTTGLDGLLAGLEDEPRGLLLTHIHLDHAGAAGALVRRFPNLRVYVHEIGAPHLADPSKLLASAGRLYGDQMERLWGEVAPVPEDNLIAVEGGEEVEGFRVEHTPGHASHHVCYLDTESGDAFVGDVAGVRIPPSELTLMPTPPPEIDVEAWEHSLELVRAWRPSRLRLTHFGAVDDPQPHIDRALDALRAEAAGVREADRETFGGWIEERIDAETDPATAATYRQAIPPHQIWLGLERYWRKRGEADA